MSGTQIEERRPSSSMIWRSSSLAADGLLDELFRQLGQEIRLTGADHLGDAVRRVGIGRVSLLQLVGPLDLLGVLVRDREALDLPVRPTMSIAHQSARRGTASCATRRSVCS